MSDVAAMSRTAAVCLSLVALVAHAQETDGGFAGVEDAGSIETVSVDAGQPTATSPLSIDAGAGPVSVKAAFGEGATLKVGGFSLNLRGRVQTQGAMVFPSEGSSALRTSSLVIRRARLALKGAATPYHLDFTLQLAFANQDMEADAPNVLRDFYVQWTYLRDLSIRFGQMKVPFDVQRIISSSSLQFVDRTLVTGELNLDRDVGIVLYSDDLFGWGQRLRYAVGVFGGDGRNRIGANVGLLYAGRLRFSFFAPLDDKVEGDPDRSEKFRLALGVGAGANVLTNRPRSTLGVPYIGSSFNYTHFTADLHLKWRGVSLLSEVYWRQADRPSNVVTSSNGGMTTEYSRSGWGFFAQGGVYVLPWLELGARYGELFPLAMTDPKLTRTREVGGVVNFMVQKHDLKLQLDYHWLDDGLGGNGRHQVRAQAQVFF
jgi:phosphate-selective porin OprO and OprP